MGQWGSRSTVRWRARLEMGIKIETDTAFFFAMIRTAIPGVKSCAAWQGKGLSYQIGRTGTGAKSARKDPPVQRQALLS